MQRINDLQIFHDTINFILKASMISQKLGSAKLAYRAISENFFKRENGYGIKIGEMRSQRPHTTTPNSVREKWKDAPHTAFLSFIMTETFSIHRFSPTDVHFFTYLHFTVAEDPGEFIARTLSLMQVYMKSGTVKQNKSIIKWARFSQHKAGHAFLGGAMRFSKEQVLKAIELSEAISEKPLSPEERNSILEANERVSETDFANIEARK